MFMLQYAFMQRAFLVGILLSLAMPCIGIIVILRRLSMIGDALSHTSLAGVTAGLLMGINPIVGAICVTVLSALGIEFVRRNIPKYAELSIAIIMSTGIGLAAVLSGFIKTSANFHSFLFGSIVAISDFELYFIIGITVFVCIVFIFLYKELQYIAFDEEGALLSGVPVSTITALFTILTGLTVAIAARTVGALIVSSMIVIPGACAMQFSKSFKHTVILSVLFALFFNIAGLTLAYKFNTRPGGTIVLLGVATLLSIFFLLKASLRTKPKVQK